MGYRIWLSFGETPDLIAQLERDESFLYNVLEHGAAKVTLTRNHELFLSKTLGLKVFSL